MPENQTEKVTVEAVVSYCVTVQMEVSVRKGEDPRDLTKDEKQRLYQLAWAELTTGSEGGARIDSVDKVE